MTLASFRNTLQKGQKLQYWPEVRGYVELRMAWATFSRNFYQRYNFKNCDRRHQPGLHRLTRKPLQVINRFSDDTHLIEQGLLRLGKAQNDSSPWCFSLEISNFLLKFLTINAETSDLNPSVMCTSKSGNRHSLCFLFNNKKF